MFRTYIPKVDEIERRWLVDAADVPSAACPPTWRASCAASTSRHWAPHVDTGDFVIVVNAEKAILTGKRKLQDVPPHQRAPRWPSRRRPGTCAATADRMVEMAVRGMLPKGPHRPKQEEAEGRTPVPSIRTRPSSRSSSRCRVRDSGRSSGEPGLTTPSTTAPVAARRRPRASIFARARAAATVNDRPIDIYFPNEVLKMVIRQPLAATENGDKFDIFGAPSRAAARRPGRRGAPRHRSRPARAQPGLAANSARRRVPYPRSTQEGAQEVRPSRRAHSLPVLEALIRAPSRRFDWFRSR